VEVVPARVPQAALVAAARRLAAECGAVTARAIADAVGLSTTRCYPVAEAVGRELGLVRWLVAVPREEGSDRTNVVWARTAEAACAALGGYRAEQREPPPRGYSEAEDALLLAGRTAELRAMGRTRSSIRARAHRLRRELP
jgi:hypothetical protein